MDSLRFVGRILRRRSDNCCDFRFFGIQITLRPLRLSFALGFCHIEWFGGVVEGLEIEDVFAEKFRGAPGVKSGVAVQKTQIFLNY